MNVQPPVCRSSQKCRRKLYRAFQGSRQLWRSDDLGRIEGARSRHNTRHVHYLWERYGKAPEHYHGRATQGQGAGCHSDDDRRLDNLTLVQTALEYCTRPDGVRLAYRFQPGHGPTLVFLPGYMSDMSGSKAEALAGWAASEGRAMLRLDYSGCGESEGAFEDGTLDIWRDDVLAVIDRIVSGPIILIGSSMGGWLMLLVAERLGNQVAALVGIASAPDFTEWGFSYEEKASIMADGRIKHPSDYGDDAILTTLDFWQSGQANLKLGTGIALDCPVRLLHGQCDEDVPWETSLRLSEKLRSPDVQTLLVKNGDHRLSRDGDIALLIEVVARLAV